LAIIRFHCFSSKPKGSFVTGSSANPWNRFTELPIYKKLRKDLLDNGLAYSLFLYLATLGAFLLSFYAGASSDYATGAMTAPKRVIMQLLTTVAWPPMLHIGYLTASNLWIPVGYLLRRPEYPERRSRMAVNDSGIFFPQADIQTKLLHQSRPPLGSYNHYVLVPFVLTAILVAASVL
jgi:hypothetical protein